jgi:hypothetical protein
MPRAPYGRRALFVGVAGIASFAWVSSGPSSTANADDHTSAQVIVLALATDPSRETVLAEALRETGDALARATAMRASGDETRAKAADGLALEWAETARDLARAAEAERAAAELRRKAIAAEAQVQRTRALVEDGLARVGRLQKELDDSASRAGTRGTGSPESRVAVEVHDGAPPVAKAPAKAPANDAAPLAKKTTGATR